MGDKSQSPAENAADFCRKLTSPTVINCSDSLDAWANEYVDSFRPGQEGHDEVMELLCTGECKQRLLTVALEFGTASVGLVAQVSQILRDVGSSDNGRGAYCVEENRNEKRKEGDEETNQGVGSSSLQGTLMALGDAMLVPSEEDPTKSEDPWLKEEGVSVQVIGAAFYWISAINNFGQSNACADSLLSPQFRDCMIRVGMKAGVHAQIGTVWSRAFSSLAQSASQRVVGEIIATEECIQGFISMAQFCKKWKKPYAPDAIYRLLTMLRPISSYCCYVAEESVGAKLFDNTELVAALGLLGDYVRGEDAIDYWCFCIILSIDSLRNGNDKSEVFDTSEKLRDDVLAIGLMEQEILLGLHGPNPTLMRWLCVLNRFALHNAKTAAFYGTDQLWAILDRMLDTMDQLPVDHVKRLDVLSCMPTVLDMGFEMNFPKDARPAGLDLVALKWKQLKTKLEAGEDKKKQKPADGTTEDDDEWVDEEEEEPKKQQQRGKKNKKKNTTKKKKN